MLAMLDITKNLYCLTCFLRCSLAIYGAVTFENEKPKIGVKTLSGRDIERDPLQVIIYPKQALKPNPESYHSCLMQSEVHKSRGLNVINIAPQTSLPFELATCMLCQVSKIHCGHTFLHVQRFNRKPWKTLLIIWPEINKQNAICCAMHAYVCRTQATKLQKQGQPWLAWYRLKGFGRDRQSLTHQINFQYLLPFARLQKQLPS